MTPDDRERYELVEINRRLNEQLIRAQEWAKEVEKRLLREVATHERMKREIVQDIERIRALHHIDGPRPKAAREER